MTLYPNVGALLIAGFVKGDLDGASLRLFKAIAAPLSVSSVRADFEECDFSGYEDFVITAFGAPYLDPAGGSTIATPSNQFNFVTPTLPDLPVTNVVLGWYITTGAASLYVAGTFAAPVAMAQNGDALPLQVLLNFCRN